MWIHMWYNHKFQFKQSQVLSLRWDFLLFLLVESPFFFSRKGNTYGRAQETETSQRWKNHFCVFFFKVPLDMSWIFSPNRSYINTGNGHIIVGGGSSKELDFWWWFEVNGSTRMHLEWSRVPFHPQWCLAGHGLKSQRLDVQVLLVCRFRSIEANILGGLVLERRTVLFEVVDWCWLCVNCEFFQIFWAQCCGRVKFESIVEGHVLVSSQLLHLFVRFSADPDFWVKRTAQKPNRDRFPPGFAWGSEEDEEFSELGNGMCLIMSPWPRSILISIWWSQNQWCESWKNLHHQDGLGLPKVSIIWISKIKSYPPTKIDDGLEGWTPTQLPAAVESVQWLEVFERLSPWNDRIPKTGLFRLSSVWGGFKIQV